MSRCVTPGTLVTLLVLLVVVAAAQASQPARVVAQQVPDAQSIIEELDALLPLYLEADRLADSADAVVREARLRANSVETRSLSVGPLRILAMPSQARAAERLFADVWKDIPWAGDVSAEVFDSVVFTYQIAAPVKNMIVERGEPMKVHSAPWHPDEWVRAKAAERIGHVLVTALPEGFRTWNGASLSHIGGPEDLFREFATTPSAAMERCFMGDLDWCARALGLDANPEGWLEWFTPDDMRGVVARSSSLRGPGVRLKADCEDGDDVACVDFVRGLGFRHLIPAGPALRTEVTLMALEMGGEGAYARLADPELNGVQERLEHAAETELEAILGAWRERMLSGPPDRHEGSGRTRGAGLFWILLAGTLAMRSSRWRSA